jgi:hypothetical protein
MSRNRVLAIGAVLWTAVSLDVIARLVMGDLVVPASMVIMATLGTACIAVRQARRRRPEPA